MSGDFHQLIRQRQSNDSKDVARGPVVPKVLLMDSCELEEVFREIPHKNVCFHDLVPVGIEVSEDPIHVVESRADLLLKVSGVQEVAFQVMRELPGNP